MASNFKILVHRNSNNLHLKLIGDFDGSSAHQLLNLIDRQNLEDAEIFIHTNCLTEMVPFGRDVFIHNLRPLMKKAVKIFFTGDHASQLSA